MVRSIKPQLSNTNSVFANRILSAWLNPFVETAWSALPARELPGRRSMSPAHCSHSHNHYEESGWRFGCELALGDWELQDEEVPNPEQPDTR
jgi:hypothetical protein